jgi:NitT/TauT family transport system substrate-binding protein
MASKDFGIGRKTGLLVAALVATALTMTLMAPASKADDLKVWRHGVVEAKSDAGFVFMAAKGGFAEKQGIKIEMVQFKGDALALRALLAGELDSYEGSPGAPILAGSRGGDVKVVGCYWPGLTYGIYAKPEIKSPADLKGKTLAISSPGALPDLLARAVLEKYNIKPSEVRFSVMGSDGDRFKAVAAGVVDAAAASTGFMPLAKKNGVKLLVNAHDDVPNFLRFCINTSGKTIKDRGDDMAKFLAAEMNAWTYALANRDKVVALSNELTHSKPDDPRAGFIFDEAKSISAIDPAMPIPMEKLTWMRDLLVKTGNLTKPFNMKSLVDEGPREKALKLIAK